MSMAASHPESSLECLCGLFGKSRIAYYKKRRTDERLLLQSADIVAEAEAIRKEDPGIGCHKIILMLRDVFGDRMPGRDKCYEILSRAGLMLPPQRRRHTTNSNHNYRKFKNLIKEMKVTRPNQLWVADITYIDTDDGVVYLHLITDAYTHEIIGWTLSDSLAASNTIQALEMAISQAEGYDLTQLTHHSDRGSQYCCHAYVGLLQQHGIAISMTEDYKPTDNAVAERVNGIIKTEWLYRMRRPKNIEEARQRILDIIRFYNTRRPHMSNGMLTPEHMRLAYEEAIQEQNGLRNAEGVSSGLSAPRRRLPPSVFHGFSLQEEEKSLPLQTKTNEKGWRRTSNNGNVNLCRTM